MMIVQRVFGFGRNILFCRWLEPEAFGQWAMAFDFMMMAAPAAILSLPGAFGRYVEYYRQRGQLRTFLRRTTAWTAILGVCSLVAIWFCRAWVADQIFGSPTFGGLVTLCLAVLAIVIVHHYLEALFTALRMTRVVSGMQFVQSVGFAVAGVATAVVLANGAPEHHHRLWRGVGCFGRGSVLLAAHGAGRCRPQH